MPTTEAPEPLVLPFAPRRGWAEADRARRACAVAWVVAVLAVPLSAVVAEPVEKPPGPVAVLSTLYAALVLLAGPPLSYSAARVLRPHVGPSFERVARHWAAAVATPYGLALLGLLGAHTGTTSRVWLLGGAHPAVLVVEVLAASVLGVLSLAWGLLALLWRAASRRPAELGWVQSATRWADDDEEDRALDAGR